MRRGRQEPTFEVQAEYAYSAGDDAVSYFESAGLTLIPAQRHEFFAMMARRADHSFAATTIGISRPRQNGKSYAARLYALWMAAIVGVNVLYSAHLGVTVTKFFRALSTMLSSPERYPMLAGTLDHVYKQPGREGIYLNNGACIEFQTRTNGSARGDSYSVIVIDEAQYLTDGQQNSILPTASATGIDPQIIEIGTPPDATTPGTVFRRDHDAAHAGDCNDFWWMEWAVESLPQEDTSKEDLLELVYETNPMLGYRMSERTVLNEMERMSNDGFAVERLGWWSGKATADHVFDRGDWNACATDDEPTGDVCYGVKISPDGSEAALSACWMGDVPHFELVDYRDSRDGLGWLADLLNARKQKCALLAIDGRNAEALTSRLDYGKKQLHLMRTSDAISAAALMQDCIRARTVTHYGQRELDEQALSAIRRSVGRDAWCIGGEHSTAIESAACALWAAKNTKRNPSRKQRLI